jgi:hypothetical protein
LRAVEDTSVDDDDLLDDDEPDYLSYDQVIDLVGEDVARRLAPHTSLRGLDGQPCFEADSLDDLVEMYGSEEADAGERQKGVVEEEEAA